MWKIRNGNPPPLRKNPPRGSDPGGIRFELFFQIPPPIGGGDFHRGDAPPPPVARRGASPCRVGVLDRSPRPGGGILDFIKKLPPLGRTTFLPFF